MSTARAQNDSALDRLFKLPLAEFTAARNALAASLKKTGRADEAERVRELVRPSVAAWAVNQLFWQHRGAFNALLEAGDRFRDAQAAQLAGQSADIRHALDARRQALSALLTRATAVLRDAAHTPSPEMMRRITTTLEALATYGTQPGAPRAGRLTADVDPPGFEALAALFPREGGGRQASDAAPRVIPFHQKPPRAKRKLDPEEAARVREEELKAKRAAAKAALDEAAHTLKDARSAALQAENALKKAAARAKITEREAAEATARMEAAAAAAEHAKQEARRIASEAENAAEAVEDAERAIERARQEYEAVEESRGKVEK